MEGERALSEWTDEELKQHFRLLAARADTWTDADRKLLEYIVLERVKRSEQMELRQVGRVMIGR